MFFNKDKSQSIPVMPDENAPEAEWNYYHFRMALLEGACARRMLVAANCGQIEFNVLAYAVMAIRVQTALSLSALGGMAGEW